MNDHFDNTEEYGIDALKAVIRDFGWLFREITKRDVGLDAWAETPRGDTIFFQVKTGESHFYKTKEELTFYFKEKHYKYWNRFKAPIFIVGHIPEEKKTYYVKYDTDAVIKNKKGYKINIPFENILESVTQEKILDLVHEIKQSELQIDFDEHLQDLRFTSDVIDLGRNRSYGDLDTKKVIDSTIKDMQSEAELWERIIKCKKNILNSGLIYEHHIQLIESLILLKKYNDSIVEMYVLVSTIDKGEPNYRMHFQYCSFLKWMIKNYQKPCEEIKNIKRTAYYKFIIHGRNLEFHPNITITPIVIMEDGHERKLKAVPSHGVVPIKIEEYGKPLKFTINMSANPNTDKKAGISSVSIQNMMGFSLHEFINENFSIEISSLNSKALK